MKQILIVIFQTPGRGETGINTKILHLYHFWVILQILLLPVIENFHYTANQT